METLIHVWDWIPLTSSYPVPSSLVYDTGGGIMLFLPTEYFDDCLRFLSHDKIITY